MPSREEYESNIDEFVEAHGEEFKQYHGMDKDELRKDLEKALVYKARMVELVETVYEAQDKEPTYEFSTYRKRPVEIQAIQLNWKNWGEMCSFLGSVISPNNPGRMTDKYSDHCNETLPYIELTIPTLEGVMTASHGDYIIRGVHGEFYPCKPDIFEKTYEKVE